MLFAFKIPTKRSHLLPRTNHQGFTVIFAALFSKVWRLNKLVESAARFRRVTIRVFDVIIPFAVLLGLNVIFMLIWTLVDPMYYDRAQRCGLDESTSFGSCQLGRTDVSSAMAVSVAVVDFSALLLANLQAYKARGIKTDFNESGHVGIAMLGILQIFLVGTPLVFLVNDNPPAKFFVLAAIVTVVCLSVLLLIFVPKMMKSKKAVVERSSHIFGNNATHSGHQSGSINFSLDPSHLHSKAETGRPSSVLQNKSSLGDLPEHISSVFEASEEHNLAEQEENTKES